MLRAQASRLLAGGCVTSKTGDAQPHPQVAAAHAQADRRSIQGGASVKSGH